jgi:hypothetical protein
MAKKDDFEEEMRKADAAAYRASLSGEPGTESIAAFMKRTATKANRPKPAVGGPKIVTKEQMQKAGFDNLRDYMNAQRGLKRRDNFASDAQKKAFAATPRGTQTEGSAGEAEARENMKKPKQAVLDRVSRKQAEESKGPSESDIDRLIKKFDSKDRPGSEVMAEKMEKGQPKMQGAYREAFGNIRKALGFKSGGSVKASAASKRADGCAMRGKTRGKMV